MNWYIGIGVFFSFLIIVEASLPPRSPAVPAAVYAALFIFLWPIMVPKQILAIRAKMKRSENGN